MYRERVMRVVMYRERPQQYSIIKITAMTNELLYVDPGQRRSTRLMEVNYYLISFAGLYILLFALLLLMALVMMNDYFFIPSFNDSLFFSSTVYCLMH
jgi:hypothetical protein